MEQFAATLKERRLAARLSQAELAHTLGVTNTTISRWERGLVEPQERHKRQVMEFLQDDQSTSPADGTGGRYRLWWCAYRQNWRANPCQCNGITLDNACNGNYFCSHLGRGCDWAMPEHPDPELFKACFQGLMDYRAKRDGRCPHLNVVSIVGYHKCTRCGELIGGED